MESIAESVWGRKKLATFFVRPGGKKMRYWYFVVQIWYEYTT